MRRRRAQARGWLLALRGDGRRLQFANREIHRGQWRAAAAAAARAAQKMRSAAARKSSDRLLTRSRPLAPPPAARPPARQRPLNEYVITFINSPSPTATDSRRHRRWTWTWLALRASSPGCRTWGSRLARAWARAPPSRPSSLTRAGLPLSDAAAAAGPDPEDRAQAAAAAATSAQECSGNAIAPANASRRNAGWTSAPN